MNRCIKKYFPGKLGTFESLLSLVRELLREKVKNGYLTERGMARAIGVSQPHLHNILKGIRTLPPELADQLLVLAGLSLHGLMGASAADPRGTRPNCQLHPSNWSSCGFRRSQ